MKYSIFKLISFGAFLTASGLAQAKVSPPTRLMEMNANQVCTEEMKSVEPLNQISALSSLGWENRIRQTGGEDLLNPVLMKSFKKESQVLRDKVSSSHLVNLLAEELRKITSRQLNAIQEGRVQAPNPSTPQSEIEYQNSQAQLQKLRKEEIQPILKGLFQIYLNAVKTRNTALNDGPNEKIASQYLERVSEQRDYLNTLLQRELPGVTAKLGEITPVFDNNLPLSYRDGIIVKIRLQKAGENGAVTVYPRMLANFILDGDEYFINGLLRWKEFTAAHYDYALSIQGRGFWKNVGNYLAAWFGKSRTRKEYDEIRAEDLNVLRQIKDAAAEDYHNSLWVHKRMRELSGEELYGLLDLFKALRFGDIPECREVLTDWNKRMRVMLRGELSSSSEVFTAKQKVSIDHFAKDVVFYQDIFGALSSAAANKLATPSYQKENP